MQRVAVGLLMTPVRPKHDLWPAKLDIEDDDVRQAGKHAYTLNEHEDSLLAADAEEIAAASPESAVMTDDAAEVASFLAKAGPTQHLVTLRNNDVLTMKNLENMRKPDVKKCGLNIGEAATLMKRLANHKAQV